MPREPYKHKYAATPATVAAASVALEVQDAVNMRAIVSTMLKHMDTMRNEPSAQYPYGINGDLLQNHPVVILFLDKLNSLARIQGVQEGIDYSYIDKRISESYDACHDLSMSQDTKEFEVYPL